MTSTHWFTHTDFKRLDIEMSVSRVLQKSISITDKATIQDFVARISKLSPAGDKMVSWADDVEVVNLEFISDTGNDLVSIYNGCFKTPSTGFNERNDTEKVLYENVLALL